MVSLEASPPFDDARRLKLALDAARMAVWDYEVPTSRVVVNPGLNRLLGFPPDAQPDYSQICALYQPGEEDRLRAAAQQAVSAGERFFEVEYRASHPDGQLRWFQLRAEIVNDAAGAPIHLIGVLMDVTDRKQLEENQNFLVRELEHRIKNILATVVAIATQTLRKSGSIDEARRALTDRLQALALGHQVVVRAKWGPASLRDVVENALAPYLGADARMRLEGPDCMVSARQALTLTLALHELATNAVKYGALCGDRGTVAIAWTIPEPGTITFNWEEDGGPEVHEPRRVGFGTQMIKTVLAEDFHGRAELRYRPEGLVFDMTGRLAP
jgi:PAS domain S-box-containing protein